MGRNPIPAPMTSAVLAKFRDANEMPLVTLDFSVSWFFHRPIFKMSVALFSHL